MAIQIEIVLIAAMVAIGLIVLDGAIATGVRGLAAGPSFSRANR
jgi:hypothetical protein